MGWGVTRLGGEGRGWVGRGWVGRGEEWAGRVG